MISGSLTYRLFQDDDLPALLQLWERETTWGAITAGEWREWFIETPFGAAPVVVITNTDDEVVGQMMMLPARVVVDGTEVSAVRFTAPIIRGDLRQQSLLAPGHPAVNLFRYALQVAQDRSVGIVFALPQYGWLPFFRSFPRHGLPAFAEARFGCAELSLGDRGAEQLANQHELVADRVRDFGAEYTVLWRSAVQSIPICCGIVRQPAWLRYKHVGSTAVAIRDYSGQLRGYVAVRKDDGLLVDLLADDLPMMLPVLATGLAWLCTHDDALNPSAQNKIKAMRTPIMTPFLEALGFQTVQYEFGFVCHNAHPELSSHQVDPDRWFLMPGD